MNTNKVNLFVVGAMKAGTTSFMELLSKHQGIYVSPIKEPHYFIEDLPNNLYSPSRFFNIDTYFEKDFPKPHHITKIQHDTHYLKLFSLTTNEKYLAEGSTAYLPAEESASLIYEYNPNAKIIILRRDPLERTYSHYKMDLGLGRIKSNFEEILKKEIINYYDGTLSWFSYLGMSFYNKSIQRYLNLFSDVLIIEFEDLITNRIVVLDQVSKFLDLKPFTNINLNQKNKTKALRFQKLFYFLNTIGVKDYFSLIFSYSFKQWLFKKVSRNDNKPIVLSKITLRKVNQIFEKESL